LNNNCDKVPSSQFFAHSTEKTDKSDWQPLQEHLSNVASKSGVFATDFDAGDLAYFCGLYHDLGKYSPDFQRRLEGGGNRVDHSTAGAIEATILLKDDLKPAGLLAAYLIAGHHGGLLNYGSPERGLCERLRRKGLPDYSAYKSEIFPALPEHLSFKRKATRQTIGFCYSFFTRMLYSCLVDADSLDTEFACLGKTAMRGQHDPFETLRQRFEKSMVEIQSRADDSLINRERKKIFDQCVKAGSLPQGIFSLTVPTGGGKTLSSMAFALEHWKIHNLKRIFYVIPYTSIIEQNANIFREIFGERNVLEHHSNFDPARPTGSPVLKSMNEDPVSESLTRATENWDIPIVVTTNVQFFESLFSNRRSRCRKLHNLAKSVIILDEAQMLPTGYLRPCLEALSELVRNYGATVVICTATQPKLGALLDETLRSREIMQSPQALYETFRRVRVSNLGSLNDAELSQQIGEHRQVLCIVNTRSHAKKLFENIREDGNCYHLSARMCPIHRREKIAEIKSLLKEGKDCRVISTQLIEAGVDIDFPVVYRAMTGIDSIAQASGRCNREGKNPRGDVFVFKSLETHGKGASWQNRVAEISEMVVNASPEEDPISLKIVEEYFRKLYQYECLDQKEIISNIEKRSTELAFPFEDVDRDFELIEKGTNDLIIPFDEIARKTIGLLRNSGLPWKIARTLQGYSVSIRPDEFQKMDKMNAIEKISDRFFVLRSREDYSNDTGLLNRWTIGYDGSLLMQ